MPINVEASAKVDPELTRQLASASAPSQPVEAVFMLHPHHPSQVAAEPEVTDELAKNVLDRVTHDTGIKPQAVNVFRNLGSFAVVAHPEFLHALMQQPEIASAVANRSSEPATIPPVHKRPVSISEIGHDRQNRDSKKPAKRTLRRKR
jgi:hypothetical protein